MKRLYLLLILSGSVLTFQPSCSVAKQAAITSQTASAFKEYTVVNAGDPIVFYKYQHQAHSPKEAEKYAPKYFFTTASSDVLQPLTKDNVKKAFPENHPFHDAIDATFRLDDELTMYDTFHKMYKLNWLLKEHQHS